jgi:hypothetical protein
MPCPHHLTYFLRPLMLLTPHAQDVPAGAAAPAARRDRHDLDPPLSLLPEIAA